MANYQNYKKGIYTESDRLKNLNSQADYWNKQQLQNFNFRDFDYSDRTKGLQTRVANLGDYNFSKQQDWDKVLSDLKNMKDFSYDVNGDALYQQYKDQYTTQGKLAMQDTMGQAAAMTGGYGNSYAQSVGQQAYQGYLSQLNNVIPELYQLALSKYNSDRDDLYRRSDLYQSLHDSEYAKYADNRDYLTDSMYQSEASDLNLYNTQYQKAYDENQSHNSNIMNNRSYYTGAASDLSNQEWGQYVDNESLAAKAIEIANDNAYKQNQYDFNALEEQYKGYMSPEEVAAYRKAENSEAVSTFRASLPTGREWSRYSNGDGTYSYGGKRYESQEAAVGGIIDRWAKEGKLTDPEEAWLKGYYGVDVD